MILRVAVLTGLLMAGASYGAANAQVTAKPDVKPNADSSFPQAKPAAPAPATSQHGVIAPPHGVDPGIHTNAPSDGGKMPVIPPPGTPGGNQTVQPK